MAKRKQAKRRSTIAKDLHTPKYRRRVIPDKRKLVILQRRVKQWEWLIGETSYD